VATHLRNEQEIEDLLADGATFCDQLREDIEDLRGEIKDRQPRPQGLDLRPCDLRRRSPVGAHGNQKRGNA